MNKDELYKANGLSLLTSLRRCSVVQRLKRGYWSMIIVKRRCIIITLKEPQAKLP